MTLPTHHLMCSYCATLMAHGRQPHSALRQHPSHHLCWKFLMIPLTALILSNRPFHVSILHSGSRYPSVTFANADTYPELSRTLRPPRSTMRDGSILVPSLSPSMVHPCSLLIQLSPPCRHWQPPRMIQNSLLSLHRIDTSRSTNGSRILFTYLSTNLWRSKQFAPPGRRPSRIYPIFRSRIIPH